MPDNLIKEKVSLIMRRGMKKSDARKARMEEVAEQVMASTQGAKVIYGQDRFFILYKGFKTTVIMPTHEDEHYDISVGVDYISCLTITEVRDLVAANIAFWQAVESGVEPDIAMEEVERMIYGEEE